MIRNPAFKNNIIGFSGITIILILLWIIYSQERTRLNYYYGGLFYRRAQECGERCKLQQRLGYYRKAIYYDPNHVDAYYQMGVLYSKTGNPLEASQFYRKAASLDPSHFMAYFQVGLDYLKRGQPDFAMRFFNQAYRFDNNFAELHYYMGRIYEKKKEWNRAQWHYMRAISINDKHVPAHVRLGMVYHLGGYDKLAVAEVSALRSLGENDMAEQLEYFFRNRQLEHILGNFFVD